MYFRIFSCIFTCVFVAFCIFLYVFGHFQIYSNISKIYHSIKWSDRPIYHSTLLASMNQPGKNLNRAKMRPAENENESYMAKVS